MNNGPLRCKDSWYTARVIDLRIVLPEVFHYEKGRTCLYIGASRTRAECVGELLDAGWEITLVEAFQPNAEFWYFQDVFKEVIHADIAIAINRLPMYDMVMWWHGPEHVIKTEFFDDGLLSCLELRAKRFVVFGCPYGECQQGVVDRNVYEIHYASLYPEDFERHGYQVKTLGRRDVLGSHITAWKRMQKI